MASREIANALTVDVEDYFQVSAFESRVSRKQWDQYECRVVKNTETLLRIFDEAQVRCTFFLLGWVVERYPGLAKRIAADGHELASHGYWHRLVYDMKPDEFADDIRQCHDAIATATGINATAYRAPSFSITGKSLWSLSILAQLGYEYDSSIFPMAGHDRYGYAEGLKEIHQIQTSSGALIEFPPTVGSLLRIPLPVGGGYFRIFPLSMTRRSITVENSRGNPAMFYTHPWEYDPGQPRIDAVSWKSHFRHYTGLKQTAQRLKRTLRLYRFDTLTASIDEYRQTKTLRSIEISHP